MGSMRSNLLAVPPWTEAELGSPAPGKTAALFFFTVCLTQNNDFTATDNKRSS
jgi:hypothetical protein